MHVFRSLALIFLAALPLVSAKDKCTGVTVSYAAGKHPRYHIKLTPPSMKNHGEFNYAGHGGVDMQFSWDEVDFMAHHMCQDLGDCDRSKANRDKPLGECINILNKAWDDRNDDKKAGRNVDDAARRHAQTMQDTINNYS
ncbi:MAG: hypothetical protein M1826_007149 [Phylliscum demangeonii]|nr:MAG: hypothetical protein M1826_007149 [Phylliscum demangeonii]